MANGAITIGKIFGIPIELNWMFILLIAFFFYLSPIFGFVWVLLFICVLIHELSHSLTALRNGITVSRIILLPIGGASIINDVSIDPDVEFRISLAGPLMSFLLGGIFGIIAVFMAPGPVTYFVQYLFSINILLGVFNILPAFPMDGGRVLRSYLEKTRGMFNATVTTVKVSRYCMGLILLATAVFVIFPNSYDVGSKEIIGLWNVVIVFFLYQGSNAELNNVMVRRETAGMTVSSAITKNYSVIPYKSTTAKAFRTIKSKREHIILSKLPKNGYVLVEIFNADKLKNARMVKDLAVPIPNISADTPIVDAIARIDTNPYRIAAVVKKGKLVGIATGNYISAFIALHMMRKKE